MATGSTTFDTLLTTSISASGEHLGTTDISATRSSEELDASSSEVTGSHIHASSSEGDDLTGMSESSPSGESTSSGEGTGGGTTQATLGTTDGTTDGTTGVPDALEGQGTCETPFVLEAGQRYEVAELAHSSPLLRSGGLCGDAGYEQVFEFSARSTGRVRIEVDSNPDVSLYVRHDCGQPAFECIDRASGYATETLDLTVIEGESYTVVVDGISALQRGGFMLSLSEVVPEERCIDGLDDNDNALIDCQDPGCWSFAGCQEEIHRVCDARLAVDANQVYYGDTFYGEPLFAPLHPSCVGTGGGLSEAFQYRADAREALRVEVFAYTEEEFGWFIRSACEDPAAQLHCQAEIEYNVLNVGYAELEDAGDYTLFFASDPFGTYYDFILHSAELTESEPNDQDAQANPLDGREVGLFTSGFDVDWWRFELASSAPITITTESPFTVDDCLGTLDTVIQLFDANGTLLQENDDGGATGYCSLIQSELPAGAYTVRVQQYDVSCPDCRAAYALRLE